VSQKTGGLSGSPGGKRGTKRATLQEREVRNWKHQVLGLNGWDNGALWKGNDEGKKLYFSRGKKRDATEGRLGALAKGRKAVKNTQQASQGKLTKGHHPMQEDHSSIPLSRRGEGIPKVKNREGFSGGGGTPVACQRGGRMPGGMRLRFFRKRAHYRPKDQGS